jgi:NO-binding membrane sensor protein with MHYT domain
MALPTVQQFAYGPVNPVLAFIFSFLGALFGLTCTARAQRVAPGRRRARWLTIAAVAIGGQGIWLMHFMAMLGFDVPAATIRYNIALTVASLLIAIGVVTVGLFIAGYARPTPAKILFGGMLTGGGVAAMHYTGMAALNLDYHVSYEPRTVALSVGVAVVAATAALWFTVSVHRKAAIVAAATIMAVAVCGMHYTGMYAMHVHDSRPIATVAGMSPLLFLIPITVVTAATLVGLGFLSLNMASDEDFHLTVNLTDVEAPAETSWAPRRHARSTGAPS